MRMWKSVCELGHVDAYCPPVYHSEYFTYLIRFTRCLLSISYPTSFLHPSFIISPIFYSFFIFISLLITQSITISSTASSSLQAEHYWIYFLNLQLVCLTVWTAREALMEGWRWMTSMAVLEYHIYLMRCVCTHSDFPLPPSPSCLSSPFLLATSPRTHSITLTWTTALTARLTLYTNCWKNLAHHHTCLHVHTHYLYTSFMYIYITYTVGIWPYHAVTGPLRRPGRWGYPYSHC